MRWYATDEFYHVDAFRMECLVCGSTEFDKVVRLEKRPLTDEFIEANRYLRGTKEFLQDIQIVKCQHCGLVQKPEHVNLEGYYGSYRYDTSNTNVMKRFGKSLSVYLRGIYKSKNGKDAIKVLEIGGGKGDQLMYFRSNGTDLINVEPSKTLTMECPEQVRVFNKFFPSEDLKVNELLNVSIIYSSYTFDHSDKPNEFLQACNTLLEDGGILAIEVHDLEKIIHNREFSLFEHEHYIYMDKNYLCKLLAKNGFDIIEVNPLSEDDVRANSLIVVAQRSKKTLQDWGSEANYLTVDLEEDYGKYINRLNTWVSKQESIIGYGIGGRGVMTMCDIHETGKIHAIFDSNWKEDGYLAPGSRVSIKGITNLQDFSNCSVLVFCYGYYDEVCSLLLSKGYKKELVYSLKDIVND